MASQNYLIAIALIEQNLVRAMPLGGKEIKDKVDGKTLFDEGVTSLPDEEQTLIYKEGCPLYSELKKKLGV